MPSLVGERHSGMELRVIDYVPNRDQKCANGYCYSLPVWSVAHKESVGDKVTHIEYVCNNHLIDFVTSIINNMRIRKQ